MRIGVITDTHLPALARTLDALGPAPAEFLSEVDLILHSGDLTGNSVLDWCEQFAPVLCSTGNNDPIPDHRHKEIQILDVEGWRIGMIHDLTPEERPVELLQKTFRTPVDIMISGHTHYERLELREENVMLMNSGSPSFPRQKELRLGTVGLLEITKNSVHAEIILLGETEGRPNPGQAMSLDMFQDRPIG